MDDNIYSPPRSLDTGTAEDRPPLTGFKDATTLTKWTTGILYVSVAVTFLAIISGVLEYRLLSDIENSGYDPQLVEAAERNDIRQGVMGILQLLTLLPAAVLILVWIHRANANARARGAMGMQFTPGWSVGWYFIPFANLVKPYQVMKEIWKASKDPEGWMGQDHSPLLPWWWFLWITSNILGNLSFRLSMRAEDASSLLHASTVTLLSDFVDIPLNLVLALIIRRIYRMQHAR